MPIVDLPDGREAEFPDSMSQDQIVAAIHKNFPEFAPKPERSWGQAAADTARQLGEGVNTIAGAIPNLVAPESAAAKFFNNNADYWRGEQSAPLKAKMARADTAINAAGEEGIIAQVLEAARQYSSDPALAARFVTTNLPSMIPGIGAAKVAQAAALARGASAVKAAAVATTAAGGVNAVLNAGGARGEAFEDVKRTMMAQGVPEAQAEQQAIKDSRLPAAVGAAAGFISGKTGLEGALVGRAGANSALRRAGASFATEMAGEQLEEVAPKLATNWEVSEYDGRSIGKDVGRTIVETAIGSGPGAVVGGISAARNRPADPAATPVEPTIDTPAPAPRPADVGDVLNAGSVDDAIDAAVRATSSTIAGDTPTPADIDALEDTYGSDAAGGTAGLLGDGAAPDPVLGSSEVPAAQGAGGALGSETAAQLPALGAPDAAGAVADDGAGLLPAGGTADGQPALTDAVRAAPDSAFNGDLEQSLTQVFFSDTYADDPVPLANRGFRPDEVAALEAAGMASGGYMSPSQFKLWMKERGERLNGKYRTKKPAPAPAPVSDDAADWHAFPPETGTLSIPRAEMPQIAATARGAMTQFLGARGIAHQQVEVDAAELKPTQAEFSLSKVRQAQEYEGGNRSILVSSDGHVLDGHHQWLAAVDAGQPVKAIVLDAPIAQLLDTVREFPSAGVDTSSATPTTTMQEEAADVSQRTQVPEEAPPARGAQGAPQAEATSTTAAPVSALERRRATNARQEEAVRLAAQNLEARKKTGGSVARDRIAAENPFLHFLAQQGLQIDERSDTGGQAGRKGNRMVPGFGPLYRRSGKRLDELAALAVEAGFLTQQDIDDASDTGGTRKLADMIQRAVHGNETIQKAASPEAAAPTADDRLLAEAARLGIDAQGMSADQVYDAVVEAEADEFSNSETRALDERAKEADVDLDAGTQSTLENDEELDAIFGPQSRRAGERAGETQESAAAPARGRAEETAAAREGQDLLTSYSAADVVARQDAEKEVGKRLQADKAKLESATKEEADRRDVAARMDASAENFQLGQSADDALSGQEGLRFSVSAEDTASDIPIAFLRSMQVPAQVWNRTESRFETKEMRADQALDQVREDIDTYQRMIACMKG